MSRLSKWLGFPVKDKPTITDETGEDSPVKCPYCGGTKFYEGPSGGMSTNILIEHCDDTLFREEMESWKYGIQSG